MRPLGDEGDACLSKNYVQEPDNSQNFNRYSYCLNNPLRYTDPTGELAWIVAGAVIGGVINWGVHGFEFNASGLGYFGVGALAGAVGGGITGGISSTLAGGSFMAGALGTSGAASSSGILAGMLSGAAGGAAGGFISGSGNAWVGGAKFGDGLCCGFSEAGKGALTGGVIGGVTGGICAARNNANLWDGKVRALELPQTYFEGVPVLGNNEVSVAENIAIENPVVGNPSVGNSIQQSIDPELIVERKIFSGGWPEGKGSYSVYYGRDTEGNIRYIGITKRQPELRFAEHLSSGTARSGLQYRTIGITGNLSRTQARILEQTLINNYGLSKNGGSLVNLINSISPQKWGDFTITITDTNW